MINVYPSTISDIKEAIEQSKKDVYCSEELHDTDIAKNPWTISLRGPDGTLGAIIGIQLLHGGVAYAWSVTTQQLRCFPIGYTRKVMDIIEETMIQFNLHRLQIHVKCRSDLVKWATHLGFEIEGTMKQYGKDKTDYYIMGRIR